MTTPTPCPTCRHEIEHLIALDTAITDLRAKARTHRSLRGVLAHYLDVAGQVARRHRKHREDAHGDERRATIRGLAQHLTEHAERSAA